MALVDNRLYLFQNQPVPPSLGIERVSDVVELRDGTAIGSGIEVPIDDLWLVVNVTQALAGSNTPLLAMGLATNASPTDPFVTSIRQHWQYGNIDLAGVASFGLGTGSFTGQLLCARMTRVAALRPERYLAMWLYLAKPAPAAFSAGQITAYLTMTPPTDTYSFPSGIR